MTNNKVQLSNDYVTHEVFGTSLCVVGRPYDNDAWIVEATDQKFRKTQAMPVQWQMIAPTGKREAVRIVKKVVDVYIDFGCFLVNAEDYEKVVHECIKTHDPYGLRLVASLYPGDDKQAIKKAVEHIIKKCEMGERNVSNGYQPTQVTDAALEFGMEKWLVGQIRDGIS
ncbi:hypothetical protein NSTC745_03869 [Nostoc sp. DSM 114161]|jgi:hypothetical protein|uniref:hypothetical protein n=1 Tax=Nostoc sp. DSM 114161 TaxID=3440143 RepID=UPI004046266F